MEPILAGIETEYGLLVEDRGAEHQIDDAMALVRSYPGERYVGWDYAYESPRSDLRGFKLQRLAIDTEDAKFDANRKFGEMHDVRADRVLGNGARFYNDHGHPEYATPECWSLKELALHDAAGERVTLSAARTYAAEIGKSVKVYKNNTDFHGASYGTHESYLVDRQLGFDSLYSAVMPMLVARQILTGSGKVGVETGSACDYQISQRADFFSEAANAETLSRRPVFNTRDEPHADPQKWIRLHVITCDANMMSSSTARRVGLVKLAIQLAAANQAPKWQISSPPKAFQGLSKDPSYEFRIDLEGKNWTTAYEVLESYFAAAEATLDLDEETVNLVAECRSLLSDLRTGVWNRLKRTVDWVAKLSMLSEFMEQESLDWRDPSLRSFDLEYHNVDPEEGLYHALEQMGEVDRGPTEVELTCRIESVCEPTRAFARGLAVTRFRENLVGVCWRTLTFEVDGKRVELDLPPDRRYSPELGEARNVGTFIEMLKRGGE